MLMFKVVGMIKASSLANLNFGWRKETSVWEQSWKSSKLNFGLRKETSVWEQSWKGWKFNNISEQLDLRGNTVGKDNNATKWNTEKQSKCETWKETNEEEKEREKTSEWTNLNACSKLFYTKQEETGGYLVLCLS